MHQKGLNFTEKHLCWSLHGDLQWGLFLRNLQASSLKAWKFIKKDSNSCFPVKFVKFLRASNFKQHLRTTAREPKLLRCIVFIKTMANITSRSKVLSIIYLFLFLYSRFNSTILRNLSPAMVSITVLGNEKNHSYVMF